MPDPKPPSKIKPISVPVFAISWHTSPALLPKHIYACSGGGGSAKTGVNNYIELVLTSPVTGEKNIKIDTGDDVAVALDMFSFKSPRKSSSNSNGENDKNGKESTTILLAVGVRNSVTIYRILVDDDDDSNDDATDDATDNNVKLLGTLDLGEEFLTNTVAFDALGGKVAVGGENSSAYVCGIKFDHDNDDSFSIQKENELGGHIKGICKMTYHPTNLNILLSSAKDGTCRVWDLSKPVGEQCLDTLQCKIYDPKDLNNKKKPIPKKTLNPAPGQCLVKGCSFADLQGTSIYTIQSGRRGKSFLSIWRLVRVPVVADADKGETKDGQEPPSQQQPSGQQQEPQPEKPRQYKIVFQEQSRRYIADFPISAVSLSGDFSTLALGDANGTVMLYNTEKFKKIKHWECIHDLPVTSIAARPLPLQLAGEDKTGIAFDAICTSADSKMCFLTKQRKSTLRPVKKNRGRAGSKAGGGSIVSFLTFIVILFWISLAVKVSYDVCSDEFEGLVSFGELQNVMRECVVHTVWWAPQDRPGIAFVPT